MYTPKKYSDITINGMQKSNYDYEISLGPQDDTYKSL